MIKKTITYDDLNGGKITEDFYFHMTKADLAELEETYPGGLRTHLMTIVATEDKKEIIKSFKFLIAATVGQRLDDVQFVKTPEFTARFMNSDAYSELVISFFQKAGGGAEFVAGVMPAGLVDKVDVDAIIAKANNMNIDNVIDVELREEIARVPKARRLIDPTPEVSETKKFMLSDFTDEELMQMSSQNFNELLSRQEGNNIPKRILVIGMRKAGQKEDSQ